ncbi:MAG TPA: sulfatase [Candidatus Limnocylindria bacterium]|nr:sulfatase [Candidatus Limnocylindria bacterium]
MTVLRGVRAAALAFVALALVGVPWDADRDGAWTVGSRALDCNDGDASIRPSGIDVPLDGVDQDCDGRDATRGSNVVLITVDTVRARNLGAYGYSRDTSPNIDALAASGATFLQAYSSSSWTVPSLATLLTSAQPAQHRTVLARSSLPETLPVLPELVKQAGYDTAVFIQSAYPLLTMGFARGFDLLEKPAVYKTPQILEWLRDHRDRPFFLWVHYSEPHTPYYPSPRFDRFFVPEGVKDRPDIPGYWKHEECRRRYTEDPETARLRMGFYDARIRESDEKIGMILRQLDALDLTRKTLVVLTADHGEEFFEHGGCDHGQTLYDEVLHIPLLIRHPALVPAGVRVPQQVRMMDIAPTVLDALELPIPDAFMGRSLLPLARESERHDRPVLGGFLSNSERAVVIRHAGFKYVWSPQRSALRQNDGRHVEELYDLRVDPHERHNLAPAGHPRLRSFRRKAERWVNHHAKTPPAPQVEFDPAVAARLRALGYLQDAPRAAN